MNDPVQVRRNLPPVHNNPGRSHAAKVASLNDYVGELEQKFRSAQARMDALAETFRDDMRIVMASLDKVRLEVARMQRQYDLLAGEMLTLLQLRGTALIKATEGMDNGTDSVE